MDIEGSETDAQEMKVLDIVLDQKLRSLGVFLDVVFALMFFRIVEFLPPFQDGQWAHLPHGILSLLASQPRNLVRVGFGLVITVYYWNRKNTLFSLLARSNSIIATLSIAGLSFLCLFMYALIADPMYVGGVPTLLLQSVSLVIAGLLGIFALRYAIDADLTRPELKPSAEQIARIDLSNPLTAIIATALAWTGLTIWTLSWFVLTPLTWWLLARRRGQDRSQRPADHHKRGERATMKINNAILILACLALVCASPLLAQQKGQWVPGQFGLNAGVIPDPGITYANLALSYSASQLNGPNGDQIIQNVSGTYSFWVDENILYYVPHHKILGGYFMPYIALNYASGSVVAALPPLLPGNTSGISLSAGGSGFADTYVQPVNIGWHLKRADFNAGYAFTAPTGRYTAGASNNVGSGYWGNNITTGTTFYITKNKGTSANLTTDWEIHGQKTVASPVSGQLSKITPGQAFTMEWGFGQILPVKKDMSQLAQLGLVGYDQWQVSNNGGNYLLAGVPVAASRVPYYSVQGIGVQVNYLLTTKDLVGFFKYYDEYAAKARPQGRTIVFGFSWTLKIPKTPPAKP
jgi:hypothetical protein